MISLQGARALSGRKDLDLRDHGWFIFFAPRDNPEIAGVVFAEHSSHGAEAAKVARYALETYFAKKDGKPAPPFPFPIPGAPKTAAPAVVATGGQAGAAPGAVAAVATRRDH